MYHVAGLDPSLLGQLIFGKYNPMPLLGVAANCDILPSERGVEHALNTGIAVVEVAV